MSARGSVYGATFLRAEASGKGRDNHTRYLVTYRLPDSTEERTTPTTGFLRQQLAGFFPGDTVNLIRDGRGSIRWVEAAPEADQPLPEEGEPSLEQQWVDSQHGDGPEDEDDEGAAAEVVKIPACSACGSTAPHHVAYVKSHGLCVV